MEKDVVRVFATNASVSIVCITERPADMGAGTVQPVSLQDTTGVLSHL